MLVKFLQQVGCIFAVSLLVKLLFAYALLPHYVLVMEAVDCAHWIGKVVLEARKVDAVRSKNTSNSVSSSSCALSLYNTQHERWPNHPNGRLMFVQLFSSLLLDSCRVEVTSCVVKLWYYNKGSFCLEAFQTKLWSIHSFSNETSTSKISMFILALHNRYHRYNVMFYFATFRSVKL